MIHVDAHTATLDLSLDLETGSVLAIHGPSGAGKTTLLRMIAGLARPGGRIEVDGEIWDDAARKIHRPPQGRRVGMVFQDYALFPHLTVRENIILALPKGEDSKLIGQLLEGVQMAEWADRKPARLSGGQQQRAALARALARRPRILLLDEALSAQDAATRSGLRAYLLALHRAWGLTTLLVTHDTGEVRRMADHVVCLENGRIVGQGSPERIWGQGHHIY
jgi:molybdate transport system ATP-binding protein